MKFKAIRIVLALLGLALVQAAWNQPTQAQGNFRAKATKVTLSEPMQLPGTVLAPGTYIFRLNDSDSNRHIVEVWNADQTKRIAIILAIANERLSPPRDDKGIMTYAERPAGQPMALNAWFYPGENLGQQFVYPKSKSEELARLNRTEVPSTGSEEAFPGEKPEAQNQAASATSDSSRRPEPTYSASAQAPAPPQTRTNANTAPAPAPRAPSAQENTNDSSPVRSDRLPNTASPLPLIGMIGTLLVSVALVLKLVARI